MYSFHMPLDTSTDRNRYWQAVRGLCILTVVLIHSQFQFGSGEVDDNLLVYERQFLNFPVATFMFLSGYFVNQDRILDRQWLTQRASRLLVPFLVWSALFTIMGLLDEPQRPSLGLISVWIFGLSSAHLYFPLALFQIVLLTPWLRRMMHTSKWWIPLLITPVYFVIIYALEITNPDYSPIFPIIFAAWISYYYTGMLFRLRNPNVRVKHATGATMVGLTASIIEASVMLNSGMELSMAASQLRFSSAIYAGGMIMLFWSLRLTKPNKLLARIGDYSFGIYFIHPVWLYFINEMAEKIELSVASTLMTSIVWQTVQVFGATVLSVISIQLVLLIIQNQKVTNYLGI